MRNLLFFLAFLPMPFLSFFRPWAGILIWGWLTLLSPHRDLWGFASTVPYNQIIAIATISGWLISREAKAPPPSLALLMLCLLFAVATISSFFSLAPELTWPKWGEFAKTFVYVLLLVMFLTTRARIHAFVWLIVLCLGFYGVKGGALFIVSGGTHQFAGPDSTTIGDRNHLAVAMLMVLPLMNHLRKTSASVWIQRGLIAAMGLTLLAVIGTYSRGGLIALIAMTALMWWRSSNKLAGVIGVMIVIAGLTAITPQAWLDRMQTIQTAEQQDESFQGRLIAWRTYWGAGTSRPLTGAGMYAMNATSNFLHYMPYDAGLDQAKAAHSIYFQLAGELGLVALTTFLGIAALSWIAATHQMKQSQDHHNSEWFYSISSAYQSSLAAYLVGGAALSLAYYDLFYILIALSVSLSRNTILHPGRSPIAASLPSRPLALRDTKQTFYPTPSANSIRR